MFEAGKSGNPNGRPKGKPNKVTSKIRSVLSEVMQEEIKNIPEHIKNLETKDRLEFILKVLPYLTPRLESVAVDLEANTTKTMELATLDTSELIKRANAMKILNYDSAKDDQ
jgi:hypothetical protein